MATNKRFRTSDGYTLTWNEENQRWFTGKTWDDRDLEFVAGADGMPVDDFGEPVDGATEETL
jgi:hypothetical protein